jgi:hypothetical protein
MKKNIIDNSGGVNRLLVQLTADKKKAVIAFGLISVMVFMWAKVLGGTGPQAAKAAPQAQTAGVEQSDSELNITFAELPKVKGRNDVLGRDFFAIGSWKDFTAEGNGEVNVVSIDGSEEVAREAAERLTLEAIVFGANPQAFINDKLLAVGDRLNVVDGANKYEFEVTGIEEKRVRVRCGEVEIALKLAEIQ